MVVETGELVGGELGGELGGEVGGEVVLDRSVGGSVREYRT